MPWKKGQSGNPGGREKRKPISDMYRRILADENRLKRFCMAQYRLAIKGDSVASRDITDRLEGKPLQSIDVNDNRQSDAASRIRDLAASLAKGNSSGRETVQ